MDVEVLIRDLHLGKGITGSVVLPLEGMIPEREFVLTAGGDGMARVVGLFGRIVETEVSLGRGDEVRGRG
jgi:hypothetical protein